MVPEFSGSMTREETVAARGRKCTFQVAPPSRLRNRPFAVNAYTAPAFCGSVTSEPNPGRNPAPGRPAPDLTALQLNPPFVLLKITFSVAAYSVFGFWESIATPKAYWVVVGSPPRFAARQFAPPSVLL